MSEAESAIQSQQDSSASEAQFVCEKRLWIALAIQLGLYLTICLLSFSFAYKSDVTQRPILLVLTLLWCNFAIHLVALWLAVQSPRERVVLRVVVLGAIAFRGVMVFSEPIQEVDIYRYCWDGAVMRQGVNPFRYSPERVRTADASEAELPPQLARLVSRRDHDGTLGIVLSRVHFAELTTIYPPISQIVYAAADLLTPPRATVKTRISIMKAVMVLFDLGVIAALSHLLTCANLHQGWLITYAWCPLVLKEFAGSGHHDAIAVFFCCWALWAFTRSMPGPSAQGDRPPRVWWLMLASLLLALGIGAKLYPLVLVPLLTYTAWVQRGLKDSVAFLGLTGVVSLAVLSPMLWSNPDQAGLPTFLTRWEMNDLVFMVVEENIKPPAPTTSTEMAAPWFVIVPGPIRQHITGWLAARANLSDSRTAFLLARLFTLGVFSLCMLWFSYRAAASRTPVALLRFSFLTLAWFWLLAPTQNPWYWTWALPLVAFAHGKAWLALSGLTLIYYVRFWCLYQFPTSDLWIDGYPGVRLFDYVIVWFEFAPWLAALCLACYLRRLREPRITTANDPATPGPVG